MFRGQWSFVILCGENLFKGDVKSLLIPLSNETYYVYCRFLLSRQPCFHKLFRQGRICMLSALLRCFLQGITWQGKECEKKLHNSCDQDLSPKSRPAVSIYEHLTVNSLIIKTLRAVLCADTQHSIPVEDKWMNCLPLFYNQIMAE